MTCRKVMISSTAIDLPEHRQALRDACERAGFEPHMMEKLPALDADSIEASMQMVDEANVYVGVFAFRYGYVPKGHDISITEMEYNRATDLNKPRLIFFIDEAHPITAKDVETGQGAVRLQALKDRIGQQRVAAFFKSPGDLKGEVVAALTTLAKKLDAASANSEAMVSTIAKLHRKTSIPAPPQPYVAHPYTLLQSRDLIGRQDELNALTDWVVKSSSPASDARIFCLVAIGGMGKSALTWKWFNKIAPNEMKQLAGRMWWSFYESDATFDNFLNRALCYVSSQSEEGVRALPWQEREAQLLRYLNDRSYLLVLDGLERILIAYNRMDASSLADDEYDKKTANWVAGAAGLPPSAAQSFTGEHRLRRTTDPRAGGFLRKLAQVAHSRIIVTTRLYPYEIQLPTGDPYPGCKAYFLRGLSDDDAVALWRGLNVTGPRSELISIFKGVENHPLLVQVFAGVVANYRKAPRDFEQWKADHPQFDPTSLLVHQSRVDILRFALEGLSKNVREALQTIVGCRMPASYATLEALLVGLAKACKSAKELDEALTELEDRGLIGWDREANRYDAHPIVRGVVRQLTSAEDQYSVYAALENHFKPMPIPNWQKVETLTDLTPAIERYHVLVELERYDEAFTLFWDQISSATLYRLAANRQRIALVERLFPNGIEGNPALTDNRHKFLVINTLANSYLISGQPGRAADLYRRMQEFAKDNEDVRATNLTLLSYALFEIGAIHQAECNARRALILIRKLSGKEDNERFSLQALGRSLGLRGEFTAASIILRRGWQIAQKFSRDGGYFAALLSELFLWRKDLNGADVWAKRTREIAETSRVVRDGIFARLLEGQIALDAGEFVRADERLRDALTRARAANLVELELPILIAIARLELKLGHPTNARILDDTWEAAESGPYPQRQADAHNVIAAIELAEGNKPAAIDAATKAYKAAWCDGPPYAYHWGLQKAKAHLAALGAPEPDMPPFDESKFEPLPEVEINPKDEYWVDPNKLD
jgi:hypothetical protein